MVIDKVRTDFTILSGTIPWNTGHRPHSFIDMLYIVQCCWSSQLMMRKAGAIVVVCTWKNSAMQIVIERWVDSGHELNCMLCVRCRQNTDLVVTRWIAGESWIIPVFVQQIPRAIANSNKTEFFVGRGCKASGQECETTYDGNKTIIGGLSSSVSP